MNRLGLHLKNETAIEQYNDDQLWNQKHVQYVLHGDSESHYLHAGPTRVSCRFLKSMARK